MKRFIAIVLLLLSYNTRGERYTVISYYPANPPYNIKAAGKDGKLNGIFADVFAQLSLLTGDEFKLISMPVARAHRLFELGKVDIEPGVDPAWRQHSKVPGLYSIAFATSHEVIVFRPGNAFKVTSPHNLYGKKVGVVRGFSYPRFDSDFNNGNILKIPNVSQDVLVQQLVKGRLDQIFMGKATIEYMIKTNPNMKELVVGDIVASAVHKMRVHPSKTELLPRLNEALKTLKQNKTIELIYSSYR